ncbi:MAG: aminopeptidase P family N-terminal domain-containing protein, partial [Planctomycetes bacterium]|nr:aminopeptidase P family N-terminal domain-containing protein [Planctomycetota bacterium]
MSDIELTESRTLTSEGCRLRQKRLIAVLEQAGADHAILTRSEHVQYLTGFRPHHLMLAAIVLDTNGHCLLVAPNVIPDGVSADTVVTYEAQWHATLRQDQHLEVARVLSEALMQTDGNGKC